jgi:hypothetical protein
MKKGREAKERGGGKIERGLRERQKKREERKRKGVYKREGERDVEVVWFKVKETMKEREGEKEREG